MPTDSYLSPTARRFGIGSDMERAELAGPPYLILGYGREGMSTHRYLLERVAPSEILVATAEDEDQVALAGGVAELFAGARFTKAAHAYYRTVIRTPGIALQSKIVQTSTGRGAWLTSQTNLFLAGRPNAVGVTGTKGKSTTSALVAAILATSGRDARLVGNIGHPMLDETHDVTGSTCYAVELSSYQLEDSRYSPRYAVLLNLYPEHLDRHGSTNAYYAAKAHLLWGETLPEVVAYDLDNAAAAAIVSRSLVPSVAFSWRNTHALAHLERGAIYLDGRPLLKRSEIHLIGDAAVRNCLAAAAICYQMAISPSKIAEAIAGFTGLEHRLEFVAEVSGVRFFNDSIATVPQSATNAIRAFSGSVATLIAGGFDRDVPYEEFAKFLVNQKGLRTIILFSPAGTRLANEIRAAAQDGPRPRMIRVATMKQAVAAAVGATKPGEVCLLSPAAASYGRFDDFEHRGRVFKEEVAALARTESG